MALDFPSSPVNGQAYDNFIYDSTKGTWKSLSSGASPNYLVNPIISNAVITATATTASTIPITVNGAASQSANLQEWKNSSGVQLATISSAGNITAPKIGLGGQTPNAAFFMDAAGRSKIRSNGAEAPGLWLTDSVGTESAFFGLGGTSSSDAAGIWHNSAWRFQVDNLGRVMMPYQPAFYVQGSGTITLSSPQQDYIMPLATAELNRGNYYNTSNYRFTAPVSGVYYFWMQACTTDATSTGPEIYISKNGSAFNNVAIAYNSAFYNTFGGGYFISLNTNDYVQMMVRNNNGTTFTLERGRSRFSGYLVG